jgi:uncharacterized membrane protein
VGGRALWAGARLGPLRLAAQLPSRLLLLLLLLRLWLRLRWLRLLLCRYDGIALWNVRGEPGIHALVWALSFISFFFLYPSTFNILEVSAARAPCGWPPAEAGVAGIGGQGSGGRALAIAASTCKAEGEAGNGDT